MKLTIGIPVYDDWDGFYFTIQSIRLFHPEVLDDIQFIVINNNPSSKQGKELKNFCASNWIKEPLDYIETDNSRGAFSKELVFPAAKTPYVLVLDCHVLIKGGGLSSLIGFFDSGKDNGGLIHGPLLYDNMEIGSTHMKPTWGSGMLGQWAYDERVRTHSYFEIPGHGMGLFACRKDAWLGFPEKSSGFGGEEYVIHNKFRNAGKNVWCLTDLQWLHRFKRPSGAPYPCTKESKYKNVIRGLLQEGGSIVEANRHFIESQGVDEHTIREWMNVIIRENAIS